MSKLSKSFKAIGLILRNPWLLNKVMDDGVYWRKRVARDSKFRNGLPVVTAVDLFGDFNETVSPYVFLDGGSLITDLALLKKLARNTPGCSYFEIGTWRGESVANIAPVARDCFTLNLSAEEMTEKGLDPAYINQHGILSKHLKDVTHLEGNSLNFDFQGLNRKFDLIFIDGDHRFEFVRNDTEKVFRHLVHDKTVVVWHDYAFNPLQVRYEVLAGILEGCPESCHRHIFHVAHTLCAVYLPGYSGGEPFEMNKPPKGVFEAEIHYKSL